VAFIQFTSSEDAELALEKDFVLHGKKINVTDIAPSELRGLPKLSTEVDFESLRTKMLLLH